MSSIKKFRAWDKDLAKYLGGCEIDSLMAELSAEDDGRAVIIKQICPARYIFEQYTGLIDKNGKEIYEGDIVKNIEGVNETAVCVWDESNAEFDFRCKDGRYTRDNVKSWLEMYEVIGNIHENPELLGGEE